MMRLLEPLSVACASFFKLHCLSKAQGATELSTTAMAQIPPPMGVCQKEGLEHDFVQAFCRLPNVPDCSEAPDKDPKQLGCYMRCDDDDKLNAAEKLYKCEDHDMVCYHQVTCILPPKEMEER